MSTRSRRLSMTSVAPPPPSSNSCASPDEKYKGRDCRSQNISLENPAAFPSCGDMGDPENISQTSLKCLSPVPSFIDSCTSLSSIKSFPPYNTVPEAPIETVREVLANHVSKRSESILRGCKNFDSKSTGMMTNTHLKQVLRTFCMPLTAAQYKKLTGNLKENDKGKVNYLEFFRSISNTPVQCKDEEPDNEFRDTKNMDELTIKLHDQIRSNLHDVVRSFWLFDYNKDGKVKLPEFRRVIENYCFKLNENQFEDLRKRYDSERKGLLDYEEFLKKIGIHSDRIKAMMPKMAEDKMLLWEEPCPKLKNSVPNYRNSRKQALLNKMEDPSIQGIPIQDVKNFFLHKLSNCGAIIEIAINMIDYLGTGQIKVDDLHNVLNCFAMPMTSSLFQTLLSKLGVQVSPILRSVDIKQFLDRFCRPDKKIKQDQGTAIPPGCKRFIDEVLNTVDNPKTTIERCMEDMGKNHQEYMTRNDVRSLLTKCLKGRIGDAEIREVMSYLDPEHENRIHCGKFLSLFSTEKGECETSPDESGCRTFSEDLGIVPECLKNRYNNLMGDKLMSKLKYHINKNSKTIDHALIICDPKSCHLIHPQQLRMILDNFCFPLTSEQFDYLSNMFEHFGDRIDYTKFMKNFERDFDEKTSIWCESIHKINHNKPTGVPFEELEEMLVDAIRTKRVKMDRDFRALDPCKCGFVYKGDARDVLCKYVMRLTDDQFKYLWDRFPLNEHNCLLYNDLINHYVGDGDYYQHQRRAEKPHGIEPEEPQDQNTKQVPTLTFKKVREPSEIIKERVEKLENAAKIRFNDIRVVPKSQQGKFRAMANPVSLETAVKEFPHLSKPFNVIKNALNKNHTKISQELRRYDTRHDGRIHFATLKKILKICDINVTEEDQYFLQEFFNVDGNSGMINYHDFMRMFMWYG